MLHLVLCLFFSFCFVSVHVSLPCVIISLFIVLYTFNFDVIDIIMDFRID